MIYLFDIAFNWSNYVKQMWNLSLGLIEDISLTTGGFKAVDNVSEKWITIKLLTVVVHWAVQRLSVEKYLLCAYVIYINYDALLKH